MYNVDRHLWAMAFDIGLVNLDAPISVAHNFYLYYCINERFNYIKWDLNECFGVFQRLGNTQLNIAQMQQLDPYTNNNSANPIVYKVWQNSRWKKMYMAHLKTIMEETCENDWFMERAQELQSFITEAVQNDPNKFFTLSDFTGNLTKSTGKIIGIGELLDSRMSYLENSSYFQYTQPDISNITSIPESVSLNSNVLIQANIINANYAFLAYRHSSDGIFEKAEMFDDGTHQDGAPGDGIWAAEIPIEGSTLEYYIYAENDEAGKFSPGRAAYDFHTISISKDIVINEFMASNSSSVEDQDGEYDDWIELYNNSDQAISLNGFYLSDDIENPKKWSFPEVSIEPDNYLIIWADKDTLQEGLHANFKLSASGESIVLSDVFEQELDRISYPPQITDVTYGRYENGIGNFEFMTSTFNAENEQGNPGMAAKEFYLPELLIYPNPTTEFLTIRIEDDLEHNVSIFNIYGQLMQFTKVKDSETIDVSHISAGIYFVNIDGISTKKIIIE